MALGPCRLKTKIKKECVLMLINDSRISGLTPERIITDIESMLRRDGGRQYCANDSRNGFYRAQLCGVNAYLVHKLGMRRLYTHDMDILINENGVFEFMRGNMASLQSWHRHLTAWRRAMSASSGAMAA
jgi:hypothetical protein